MQQNSLKCDANLVVMWILLTRMGGGGGGLNHNMRMVLDLIRGSQKSKIKWYDIWKLPYYMHCEYVPDLAHFFSC